MGQDLADVDLTTIEVDGGNETALIATNVEHDKAFYLVRRWERRPKRIETIERASIDDLEPSSQRTFGARMFFPKKA